MADNGGWPSGMSSDERQLRAVNPGLASMLYDAESMVSFKKRVDKLLVDLGDSPAAPRQVGTPHIKRADFGGGDLAWSEAAGLFASYEIVVERLKELSQLMGDCLEGMGIAVVSAKNGYGAIDEDIRRRMLAIEHNTQRRYDPDRDPTADQRPTADGTPTAEPGDSAGAGGLQ
ncbi:hypothetical protein [Streptomyces sp. TRM49041]|uniref:hypothetical protein n=1 Tax=Streptomyces sp. TRM49041 TaxID=2603216 RepID=UPI0011EFB087|nr:hypothetical protein [Streptomyces sp. TRM49041]